METLSRREEQILLAVCALKDQAYLVAIKKYLSRVFKKNLTLGSIHKPLCRLEKAGCLESSIGEATAIRGGRAKKIYRMTKTGMAVLTETKRIQDELWTGFEEIRIHG